MIPLTSHDALKRVRIVDPDRYRNTRSATGCVAAYLWKYGLISNPRFVAEQGHWMHRPGEAQVEIVGALDAIEDIQVGGEAVVLISGTFHY